MSDSISAVIPVYNAEKTIERLVSELKEVLSQFGEFSIILVDDASTDSSFDIIRRLQREDGHITAITLSKNAGQQSAVLCGLRHAGTDYVVIMDDDFENDPKSIIELYGCIKKGFDVVYGVTKTPSKGFARDLGSRVRNASLGWLGSKPKNKHVCSFRIMKRGIVEKVIKADTKFVYISLEILRYTKNIENIEVNYAASHRSGYNVLKLFWLLVKMCVYYGKLSKFLKRKGSCYEIKEILKGQRCV